MNAAVSTSLTPQQALSTINEFLGSRDIHGNGRFEVTRDGNQLTVIHYPNDYPGGTEFSTGHYKTNELSFEVNGTILRFQSSTSYTSKEQDGINYGKLGAESEGPSPSEALEILGELKSQQS